ncbi:MAG: hypothetical protein ACLTKG_07420 [Collinsella intestinalis]
MDAAVPGEDGTSVYAGDVLKRARAGRPGVSELQPVSAFHGDAQYRDAPIRVQRRDRAEVEQRARELIERMGLEGLRGQGPCRFPAGSSSVAIARALAMDPEVIFFDDPPALDPSSLPGCCG